MTYTYFKYSRLWLAATIVTLLMSACGKEKFNIAATPPDVGGSKDSASKLVDTLLKTDSSKYVQAAAFPGLVCGSEPRVNVSINMNFNYQSSGNNMRVQVMPIPQFSTGYYAAPGELVTITIPAGQVALSVQIGGWTDDLSNLQDPKRDAVIYVKTQLAPGKNYVRNLYGGHVYIISAVPQPAPVAITLSNVVKSPDFVDGVTNVNDWKAQIAKTCVPWLEIRSAYASFLVPTATCVATGINPQAGITLWNSIIQQDYYGWMGLSANPSDPIDQQPLMPYRFVLDVQPSVGYGHNGFPIVGTNDMEWFGGFTDATRISNVASGLPWGTCHELGHNMQQPNYWSWSTLGETTNNLFVFKFGRRLEQAGASNAWPVDKARQVPIFTNAITNYASVSGVKNFDTSADSRMINDPSGLAFVRMVPFVQLFDYIKPNMAGINKSSGDGWGIMTALYSKARRAVRPNISDLTKHDFVYQTVCDYTQYDWAAFFDAWGIVVSDAMRAQMGSTYSPIKYNVWTYNPLTRTGGTGLADQSYNPTSWKIVSFSSQNADGGSGLANYVIDGNTTTYWHTQYSPANVNPPHFIVIDLQKQLSISSIQIAHRPNGTSTSRAIQNIFVDYSTDNVNWKNAPLPNSRGTDGTYIITQNIQGFQQFKLTAPITARYMRVRVPLATDMFVSSPLACLAEFEILP